MTGPDLSLERAARAAGALRIAGVDEVGRGPWAGPVTACAAILRGPCPPGLDDSKKLSIKARDGMEPWLRDATWHAIGEASVQEIDAVGIRRATHLAMARALLALPVRPDLALVDGNDLPGLPCPARAVVKGDTVSRSIAAASVLAKTWRDRGMVALAQRHPGYGWETNMGYGTAAHRLGLERHGVTQHHRRSFAPIHNILRR